MNASFDDAFWNSCGESNPSEADALEELRELLAASIFPLARLLAGQDVGSTTASFKKRDVRLLEIELCHSVVGFAEQYSVLKRFSNLIDEAVRRGVACIPAATLHIQFKSPEDKLSPSVIDSQRRVGEWASALIRAIKDHARVTASYDEFPSALVILAFMLFGGVLNLEIAVGLVEAFRNKESRFGRWSRGAYCDLLLGFGGVPAQEIRRLYFGWALGYLVSKVSATSAIHLLPISADDSEELNKRIRANALKLLEKEILTCLRDFGVPKGMIPKSLRDIINTMKVALIPDVPQVGIRYALRKTHERTLRPECLSQFTGWKCLLDEDSLRQFEATYTPGERELVQALSASASSNGFEAEMHLVRGACKTGNRTLAASQILSSRQELSNTSPFGDLLLNFATALLSGPASSGIDYATSTVSSCVRLAQRHLGDAARNMDLTRLCSEDLDSLFWGAIESVHSSKLSGNLRSILWALHEIYHFCRRRKSGRTDERFMFRFRGLVPVNARVISLDIFIKMLNCIEHDPNLPATKVERARAIVASIAMFGAGLRPAEAVYVREIDWMGDGKVRIEEHNHHSLKTRNALRIATNIFPELLDFEERSLQLLNTSDTSPEPLLLTGGRLTSVEKEKILEVINLGLRHVTGDPTANAYILRHAHCSLLRLALFCADKQVRGASLLASDSPLTFAWLDKSDRTKRLLMGSAYNTNYGAWAVAKQLGHLNPSVHSTAYAHLADVCMPIYLEGIFAGYAEKVLESAIAPSTLTYNKHCEVIEIARREVERAFGANSTVGTHSREKQSKQTSGWCSITASILRHPSTMSETLAETAKYLDVERGKAEGVVHRSRRLYRIRHGEGESFVNEGPQDYWVPGGGRQPKGFKHLELKLFRLHQGDEAYVTDELASWAHSAGDDGSVTFFDLDRARNHIGFLKKLDVFRGDLRFEVHGVNQDSEFASRCIKMLGRGANVRVVRPTTKSREQGPRLLVWLAPVADSVRGRKHVSGAALEYVLECGFLWFDTDL